MVKKKPLLPRNFSTLGPKSEVSEGAPRCPNGEHLIVAPFWSKGQMAIGADLTISGLSISYIERKDKRRVQLGRKKKSDSRYLLLRGPQKWLKGERGIFLP